MRELRLLPPDPPVIVFRREDHPSAEEVAAYLDRGLDRADRARLAAHFASCARCRAELDELRGFMGTPLLTRRRRLAPRFAAAAAAVAAVAALVLIVPRANAPSPADRLRTPARAEGVATIAVSPTAGDGRSFAWQPVAPDALYRFALADARGEVLWSASTRERTVSVPDSIALAPGSYYWYVDALLSGTRTATSGVQRLEVGR